MDKSETKVKHKKQNNPDEKELLKLRSEIESLQQALEKSDEMHKRALADYKNLERRSEEEKSLIVDLGTKKIIKDMLEVLDDLEASVLHIKDSGLESVLNKMKKILKNEGLEEIEPIGETFNPEVHEAIDVSDGEKDKVTKAYRKGYFLNGRLLRAALVSVGNGNQPSEN